MTAPSGEQLDLISEFEKELTTLLPPVYTGDDQALTLYNPSNTYVVYQQDNTENTPPTTPLSTRQFVFSHVVAGQEANSQVLTSQGQVITTPAQNVIPDEPRDVSSERVSSSENVSPEKCSLRHKHKYRKRRVVVTPRTRHTKRKGGGGTSRTCRQLRSSSSSFAPTSSAGSSASPSPPRSKKRVSGRNKSGVDQGPEPTASGGITTVARFQCRVCGLTRFLALAKLAGLPSRLCECGSGAMIVASWVRMARGPHGGLTGGGLGRECVRCPRCHRLYCSEPYLKRHHCSKPRSVGAQKENATQSAGDGGPQEWPGVSEVPSCSQCGEAFIFDCLLERHIRREHR